MRIVSASNGLEILRNRVVWRMGDRLNEGRFKTKKFLDSKA
jgi:hypothetical protein